MVTNTDAFVQSFAGGTVTVTAGRVALLDVGSPLRVLSDPAGGNVTVNPDGTLALVLTDSDHRGKTSFRVEVAGSNGPETVTVGLNVVSGTQTSGWGEGDHYTLQVDDDDITMVEPGRDHRKVYVTKSADALSLSDIATREKISVSKIDGEWLEAHPEYGATEGMVLDPEAGIMLWNQITGRHTDPSSDWFLLERGYDYGNIGRLISRGAMGESALHPLLIGAWGEGDRPIVKYGPAIWQDSTSHVVARGLEVYGGTGALLGENVIFDDMVIRDTETVIKQVERFTLRNSQLLDVADGENITNGIYIAHTEGILIENVLADHNGWEDGWEDGDGRAPNKFSHNFYLQFTTNDVTFRDNVSLQASSTGAQIRSGGFVENNLFAANEVALLLASGVDEDGNYSLALDNIITLAGYKEAGGATSLGFAVRGLDASLLGNIITHLTDPTDLGELGYRTRYELSLVLHETPFADDTIVYNWITENFRDGWRHVDMNVPEDISEAELNEVTLKAYVEDILGLSGGSDGVEAFAAWLRENWDDIDGASGVVGFFQDGFGIELPESAGPATHSFVPDVRGEGFRWDNRLNWSEEYLPEDGDSVDLAGNWVTYSGTTRIAGVELGEGGILTVRQGYLEVGELSAGAGGAVKVDLAGQIWTDGYDDVDTLTVTVAGGRFANTGLFEGPVDIDVTGGETLLATGGARFALDGVLSISGPGAAIGFDGQGGTAALDLEDGAVLHYTAGSQGVSAIREFRSGHWGTAAPDVLSRIDLGAGDTTLSLDVAAITGKSGVHHYTLADVDAIAGGFGAIAIAGGAPSRVSVIVDHAADRVELVTNSAGWGGSQPLLELIGSAGSDVFHTVTGARTLVRDYQQSDVIDLSATLAAADLSGLRLGPAITGTANLLLGGQTLARIEGGNLDAVRVRIDGVAGTVDLSGSVPGPKPQPTNADPVASSGAFGGAADAVVTGKVTASDADGDPLSFALASAPGTGAVTMSPNGSFSYDAKGAFETLAEGETRTVTFTYRVTDGEGGSDDAEVTLALEGRYVPPPPPPTNADPVASSGAFGGAADAVVTGKVTASDADGDPLSFALASAPGTGAVTMSPNGSFSYDAKGAFETLAEGETRTVTFTYRVTDGEGGSDDAEVTLALEGRYVPPPPPPTNADPVASSGAFGGAADAVVTGKVTASDADGDPLSFALASAPGTGAVTMSPNGSFSYDAKGAFETLAEGETRTVTFTYRVTDGEGGSDDAEVTLALEGRYVPPPPPPTNADPVASSGAFGGAADAVVTGKVTASDADGDPLSFALASAPGTGAVTMSPNGSFSYDAKGAFETLAEGETRTVTFTYRVTDGEGGSDDAEVTLTLEGRYVPPPPPPAMNVVEGTDGIDVLRGTGAADILRSGAGGFDRIWGNGGGDHFVIGAETRDGVMGSDQIFDFDVSEDVLVLEEGAEIASTVQRGDNLWVTFEGDGDLLILGGPAVLDGTIETIETGEFWLG